MGIPTAAGGILAFTEPSTWMTAGTWPAFVICPRAGARLFVPGVTRFRRRKPEPSRRLEEVEYQNRHALPVIGENLSLWVPWSYGRSCNPNK